MVAEPVGANTLAGMILDSGRRWPDKVAVKFPRQQWTYRTLVDEAMVVAQGLRALGVQRGDHVGILLPNGTDFLRAYFGVTLASGVCVNLNIRYRRSDLSYVVAKSDVRVLILSADYRSYFDFEALLAELIAEGKFPKLEKIVVLGADDAGEFVSEPQLRALAAGIEVDDLMADASLVSIADACTMLFTSGTTAFPKGCVLSHEAIVRTAAAWGRHGVGLSDADTIWIPNPLFHVGALTSLVASTGAGATLMSMPYFEPDGAVEMLCANDVTIFFPVFDSVAMPILDHPRAAELRIDKMRYCFTIGNPMNIERVKARIPQARHINVYGMTETSGWCVFNHDMSQVGGPYGGGFPVPGVDLRLDYPADMTDSGGPRVGEICIRSWCTLTEYYNDPAATAKAIDAQGWFHTGDMGWLDDTGCLHFHGRAGDMLKVGGENVAPVELEELIGSHDAVRIVAVVGVSDARLGQVPAAFVELQPGRTLSESEVIDFCRPLVARFKLPRYVRFVKAEDWPMSATKIRKPDLCARIEAELKPASVDVKRHAS